MWRALVCLALISIQPAWAQVTPPIRYAQRDTVLLAEARNDSARLDDIVCGAPIAVIESALGAQYVRVHVNGRQGFVPVNSLGAQDSPRCIGQAITRATQTAMLNALISELTARDITLPDQFGPCRCPTDRASDGRLCGGRSSFSRLGGLDPAECI